MELLSCVETRIVTGGGGGGGCGGGGGGVAVEEQEAGEVGGENWHKRNWGMRDFGWEESKRFGSWGHRNQE